MAGPVVPLLPGVRETALLWGAFGKPGVLFWTDASVDFTVAPVIGVLDVPT